MSESMQSKSLPTDKFLTIAINILNNELLEVTRTEAKQRFRQLEAGKDVPLTHLEMEDKSLVRFDLGLNYERYQGKFNFSSFRTGLTLLIANIVEALKNPDKLQTFRNEQNPDSMLFAIPAVTVEEGKPSILLLGADAVRGQPLIKLQLTYIDNVQFEDQLPVNDDNASA